MNYLDEVTEIYVSIDDFHKEFSPLIEKHSISSLNESKKRRNRKTKLSLSEVMPLLIFFHLGGYRTLKHFYLNYVCKHMNREFPSLVSYTRFVELQQKTLLPQGIYLKLKATGMCTETSFIASTLH